MEASHKKHRPHIKVGKDADEEEEDVRGLTSEAWKWADCMSKHSKTKAKPAVCRCVPSMFGFTNRHHELSYMGYV